jgi:hypothetical protein
MGIVKIEGKEVTLDDDVKPGLSDLRSDRRDIHPPSDPRASGPVWKFL